MPRYHAFEITGIAALDTGQAAIAESDLCGPGLDILAGTAIGLFTSTGYSAIDTWHHLRDLGLSSDQLRNAFDRLGVRI